MAGKRRSSEDEWLSAHLFFDGNIYDEAADRMLLDVVAPLVEECGRRGLVKRWFFIRYSQGGPHIRLRLLSRGELVGDELRRLIEEMVSAPPSGAGGPRIRRLEWIPYEPELERYGGPKAIGFAEVFFAASSQVALALLRQVQPGDRPSRLGKAILAILVVLYSFEGTRKMTAEFGHQYGRSYLRALAPQPRQQEEWLSVFERGFDRQANRLAAYLEAAWEELEGGGELPEELDFYRTQVVCFLAGLRTLCEKGSLHSGAHILEDWPQSVRGIVASCVHMMNNRLGITIQEESYLSVLIDLTFKNRRE